MLGSGQQRTPGLASCTLWYVLAWDNAITLARDLPSAWHPLPNLSLPALNVQETLSLQHT